MVPFAAIPEPFTRKVVAALLPVITAPVPVAVVFQPCSPKPVVEAAWPYTPTGFAVASADVAKPITPMPSFAGELPCTPRASPVVIVALMVP